MTFYLTLRNKTESLYMFTEEELLKVKKRKQLLEIAKAKNADLKKIERNIRYEEELRLLQAELVNLQQWVAKHKLRIAVIFEGRDAAGKGGSIKRFTEHLNPRVNANCGIVETNRG